MTTNPKELEARARELLLMDDGHTRFGVIVNYRVYVDEAAAIRAITRALSQPAEPSDAAVEDMVNGDDCPCCGYDGIWTTQLRNKDDRRAAIAAMRGDEG